MSLIGGVAFCHKPKRKPLSIVVISCASVRVRLRHRLTFGMGNFATTYAVPVFGQLGGGMSATDAGMLMMPAGLIGFALPFTGRLADKSKPHYIIMCGLFFFFFERHFRGADANTPYCTSPSLAWSAACNISSCHP